MKAKSVTDINQSRELSEFLAIEKADFGWDIFSDGSTRLLPIDDWDNHKSGNDGVEFVPAWSLSALLDEIPDMIDGPDGEIYILNMLKEGTHYNLWYDTYGDANPIEVASQKEMVDVCVELLIELHKKKLI